MASFITRVELHSASLPDYEKLHSAMSVEGFRRTIKGDDGIWYQLPTAEYSYSGSVTIADVLAKARRAAEKTGKSSGILVSEYVRATWSGLSRVAAQTA